MLCSKILRFYNPKQAGSLMDANRCVTKQKVRMSEMRARRNKLRKFGRFWELNCVGLSQFPLPSKKCERELVNTDSSFLKKLRSRYLFACALVRLLSRASCASGFAFRTNSAVKNHWSVLLKRTHTSSPLSSTTLYVLWCAH